MKLSELIFAPVDALPVQPDQSAASGCSDLVACNFEVKLPHGKLSGQFTYSPTSLTGVGYEVLTLADNLQWVHIADHRRGHNGANYTEVDDLLYPTTPYITFEQGQLLGLQFVFEQFAILETDYVEVAADPAQTRQEYLQAVTYFE